MNENNNSIYFTEGQDPSTYSLSNQIAEHLEFRMAKTRTNVTKTDVYKALAYSVRDRMIRSWLRTQEQYKNEDVKKVHYLSLEFLMGRLLGNALTNLGFYEECYNLLRDIEINNEKVDLEEIIELENDMGLGNGGLGRLAACFLDSMATLELPAFGYGIRYQYGIFEQDIENGYQIEKPDNWLKYGNPWEIIRPELTYRIKFFGQVRKQIDQNGKEFYRWEDTEDVLAVAYDIPIPGYDNNTVNCLRLWEAVSTYDFDFSKFNEGDYHKAVAQKFESETISKVLYPNDNVLSGKELRLKQQFFFVSATLQDIIAKFKQKNSDFRLFPELNVIQLNDTHPAVGIPELMRILMDEEGLGWDLAWEITQKTFAYTNHTVLSEALEKWSVSLFGRLLPRHLQIIYEINFRFLEKIRTHYRNDVDKLTNMSIIQEGDRKKIRMSNLAIVGSFSVNGVARLHTEILKDNIFRDFYEYWPEKFNSKTNGITQRRWLKKANPFLAQLINDKIGDGWAKDLYQLRRLEEFIDEPKFIEDFQNAKWLNKKILIEYLEENYNININPNSIFDVQIKRMHEYKRQLLNVLHVITLYNRIKDNPNGDFVPRTVLFAGKAAPGYYNAKLIIKLINSIARVINNDPDIGDKLKVCFVKNYSVTLAEMIIPATDLSEQISTAGFEASGTGNMKFMANGALTIGTLDGANIEMMEEMGRENMFIFGLDEEGVRQIKSNGYNPWDYYNNNEELRRVIDMINSDFFEPYQPGIFRPIYDMLLEKGDFYCHFADYEAYIEAQDKVNELYRNKEQWTQKAILNVARSGKFSSDRTIKEYADEIWNVKGVTINTKSLDIK